MISIMPKEFNLKGKRFLAGIVGDFVIKKQYQVFGPSITLLKEVILKHKELKYDFLFTLPNPAAEKVCIRAGFMKLDITDRFVKVINPGKKIGKYFPKILRPALEPILDFIYKFISTETFILQGLKEIQIENAEKLNIDAVIEKKMDQYSKGIQNKKYFDWKYFRNPLNKYKLSKFELKYSGKCVGMLFYTENKSIIHIYDFLEMENGYLKNITRKFINTKRKKKYESISIRLIEKSILAYDYRKLGFIQRNEKLPILFAGKPENMPTNWLFMDGERNI